MFICSCEEYFNFLFKVDEFSGIIGKMFVFVIYDISDNWWWVLFVKILVGFGYCV